MGLTTAGGIRATEGFSGLGALLKSLSFFSGGWGWVGGGVGKFSIPGYILLSHYFLLLLVVFIK